MDAFHAVLIILVIWHNKFMAHMNNGIEFENALDDCAETVGKSIQNWS